MVTGPKSQLPFHRANKYQCKRLTLLSLSVSDLWQLFYNNIFIVTVEVQLFHGHTFVAPPLIQVNRHSESHSNK